MSPESPEDPERQAATAPLVGGAEPSGAPPSYDPWAVSATLIGGVALWGGLGWAGDRLLDTRFLTPVGLLVGAGLALYIIAKRIGAL